MLDYIILKKDGGDWVRSDSITGLLIASLPRLTRPAMRNQIDLIDGRAGDIVTELGYSAYDKPLGIALYGNYDAQEILDYFGTKGQIIFSDESDKYYNYQILDAIELERVIKFKKGIVTFHVQPYKYPVTESVIDVTAEALVHNSGNTESRPIIHIIGKGTVDVIINADNVLTLDMGNVQTEYVVDAEAMEVYSGTVLKNRQAIGDYDKISFESGDNNISFSGDVSSATVERYTRWV